MNKKGIGSGSASIILVFAVLCLTIFAVISFVSALSNNALVKVEANMVRSYYEADVLAEYIFAEILNLDEGESIPDTIRGVEINSGCDCELDLQMILFGYGCGCDSEGENISFSLEISDKIELRVVIAVNENEMDIIAWRMRDVGEWESGDDSLNLLDDDMPGFLLIPGE
jgi:hypothetical protein